MTAAQPAQQATILVVDDTPSNISVLMEILRGDYRVLAATSGEQALKVARGDSPPDLILLDVMMPEMSGPHLARRLVEARPGLGIVYMSGYTDDAVVRHGVIQDEAYFLQKPFTLQALSRKVREVLGPPALAATV